MIKSKDTDRKPLVGFFPGFHGIGETYPVIKIAKSYQELGGKVVVFSHGGDYEYLARDQGFEIKRIGPIASPGDISRYFMEHSDTEIIEMIRNEALIYKNTGIKALLQTNVYFFCKLAPRLANVPLISIISGTLAPPYYQMNFATYPDNFENYLKKILPQNIKNRFNNWYTLNYKGPVTKKFNRIAKKINIDTRFKCFQDLILGDFNLLCDDIEFLGIKPTKEFPKENYIGPILSNDLFKPEQKNEDEEIENHLNRPGNSILLTMGGSTRMREIFLEILKVLNQTNYNVIATYTSILNDDELPQLNENILLKKFLPNITELNQRVDLAIIHGGRGTVYNVVYSGKPAIGFPLNSEQQYNLDSLARHGFAHRLSKTFFKKEELLKAIDEIFNNYEIYLKNAEALTQKLPKPEGAKNAAKRIFEITKQTMK